MEGAVEFPSAWTNLTRWLSNLVPVTSSERIKGIVTAATAIAVAMKSSARDPLIAKPTAMVDVRNDNDTTKTKKLRPNMTGVTRSLVMTPSQAINANNIYTLNSGINVSREQAATRFMYLRVVLEEDNWIEEKEFKFPLAWVSGK